MSSPKTKARRLPAWFTSSPVEVVSPAETVPTHTQSTGSGSRTPQKRKGRESVKQQQPEQVSSGSDPDPSRSQCTENESKKPKNSTKFQQRQEAGSFLEDSEPVPKSSVAASALSIPSQTQSIENFSRKVEERKPHQQQVLNQTISTEAERTKPKEATPRWQQEGGSRPQQFQHVSPISVPTPTASVSPTQTRSTEKWCSTPQERAPKRQESGSPQQPEHVLDKGRRMPRTAVLQFSNLLEGVIFTISGLVNPERSEIRQMALDMGAVYRPSWSDDSTLLVCPFTNTPTFIQVKATGSTIVHKDWISKSFEQRALVPIGNYLLHVGNPWRTVSNLDDSDDISVDNDSPAPDSLNIGQDESPVQHYNPGLAAEKYASPIEGGKHQETMKSASLVDVQNWVMDDLADTVTWLLGQSDKPEDDQLQAVAAQGLLVCLDDALKSLQENKGLSMVMDNWAFIPQAVKELAAYKASGCEKDPLIAEGERFKTIYESQLKQLGFCPATPHGSTSPARTGGDESSRSHRVLEEEQGVDDDATEIISDTDSRDPADFDSDGTVELDESEIVECKGKILQMFGLTS